MTPEQIEEWLDANSWRLDQPNQYLGTEPNARQKPWCSEWQVKVLLQASWPYFHSAGNQSIPAVYQAINDCGGHLADLSYLPETQRDMRILEQAGIPMFGIESKHQMRDFDVVATSISYMVLFMNFTKLLSMSGIPPRWEDRQGREEVYPMVLVGGQAFCAPGAMEPVVDAVWLGEVEDEPGNGGISLVISRIAMFKDEGLWQMDRLECYRQLAAEFPYLYFPRFVDVFYREYERGLEHPGKQVSGYRSLLAGMTMPLRSRHVIDLDKTRPLEAAPLLFSDPSMGAGDIEVARGCPAWCSFCRLSWVTKPYRQSTVARSVAHAQVWKQNMGMAEASPFGPDFPMFTQKKELLGALLETVTDEVDGTAMRIDDFTADGQYVVLQAAGGADSVTLGLEGSSQRMRDLVGKGTSDEDVVDALVQGIRAGLRKFKIFMIINLPGEDSGDVKRAIELARRLADIREELGQPNVLIQFSFTPLLIEAQTPFQWFAPTPPDHAYIQVADAFRELKVQFKLGTKAEPNKVALFQLCQRASREVGDAIVSVLLKHNVASWGGVPKTLRADLDAALQAQGFANGFADCFDERGRNDLFGWEFIDTGVSPQLMWTTYQQMVEFLCGTDSESYDSQFTEHYHGQEWVERCDTGCQGDACGACKSPDFRKRREYQAAGRLERDIYARPVKPIDLTSAAIRLRVPFAKPERYRFVTNQHWRYAVRRAAYRATASLSSQLPDGCNISKRSISFASDAIKVKDGARGADYLDFALTRKVSEDEAAQLLKAMRDELVPWLALDPFGWVLGPVTQQAERAVAFYTVPVDTEFAQLESRLAWWSSQDYVALSLKGDTSYFGLSSEEVNAKQLVSQLWAVRAGHQPQLRFMASGKAGPYQIAAAVLGAPSYIPLMRHPALRLAWLAPPREGDLLAESCLRCGEPRPLLLTREPYDWRPEDYSGWCPQCMDTEDGHLVAQAGIRVPD